MASPRGFIPACGKTAEVLNARTFVKEGSTMTHKRPDFFTLHNGEKAPMPFAMAEYEARLAGLRKIMADTGVEATILTSMHNIAYYSGFLYCSFGRPYACVVTQDASTTVSANIDLGQPWRRSSHENVIFTDWKRDNYWRAVKELVGSARKVGIEGDHMTLDARDKLADFLGDPEVVNIAPLTMKQRMIKSPAEIA